MRIEIKPYTSKYFFRFLFGLMHYRILKNLGVFEFKFIKGTVVSLFTAKRHWNFIIFSSGRVVGGLNMIMKSQGVCEIGIFVFKNYQRRGIATNAIKKFVSILKKKNVEKVILITNKDNLPSMKLIEHFGAKRVEENKKEMVWEKKL